MQYRKKIRIQGDKQLLRLILPRQEQSSIRLFQK